MDRLLEQLLEHAPDAILVADLDGVIRYWNDGAEQIFGYSSAEAVGRSLDLIIPENLRGRHWEGYNSVMASGKTRYQTGLLSSPGVKADAGRVSLEFSVVLLKSGDGIMQGCGTVMRDVTERWQKEKELKGRLVLCEAGKIEDDNRDKEGQHA